MTRLGCDLYHPLDDLVVVVLLDLGQHALQVLLLAQLEDQLALERCRLPDRCRLQRLRSLDVDDLAGSAERELV